MKKAAAWVIAILFVIVIVTGCRLAKSEQENDRLQALIPAVTEVPDPEVKQGQYTIFQYTKTGWTNRIYVTEYLVKDKMIFYKSREHQGEFLEVAFEDCLIEPEWIEDTETLMNYGFWEPGESDW